jgi:hypothetical protein
LNRDDLCFILNPEEVMGPSYPAETFRGLKGNEIARFGKYRTRDLTVAAWDRMEAGDLPAPLPYDRNAAALQPELAGVNPLFGAGPLFEIPEARPVALPTHIVPSTLPDGAWAMPSYSSVSVQLQLASILKKLPGATAAEKVRLAAIYALRPDYLTSQLSGTMRSDWQRLVGVSALAPSAANVISFVPGVSIEWRDAYTQLRGMHALIEESGSDTWAPGVAIQEFTTEGWPDGRAEFVLKAMEGMDLVKSISALPSNVQAWVRGHAA